MAKVGQTPKSVHGATASTPSAETSSKHAAKKAKLDETPPAGFTQAKKLVTATGTAPSTPPGVTALGTFPLSDLSEIKTVSAAGQHFQLDGGTLDGLRLQVRRVEDAGGQPGFQLDFKLAGPSRYQFFERLTKAGADFDKFELPEASGKEKSGQFVLRATGKNQRLNIPKWGSPHAPPDSQEGQVDSLQLDGTNWKVDFVADDGPVAFRGHVRISLSGSDADCTKALQEVVKKTGLNGVFAPTTPTTLRRYALLKLLWRTNPSAAKALTEDTKIDDINVKTIEKRLSAEGISKERMNALRFEEVAPGHFTVMDDQIVDEMKSAGLRYAYSTVETPEHVHAILQHGQKATTTRWAEGAFIAGLSSSQDMATGGAQGVFSRLVTKNAKGRPFNGRKYRLILDPSLLARTDVWGWAEDKFGRSWDLSADNFGKQLVKNIDQGDFDDDNEIVSPVGNDARFIRCVVADHKAAVNELREHLKSVGFTPPDGQSLESFVRHAPNIDPALLDEPPPAE